MMFTDVEKHYKDGYCNIKIREYVEFLNNRQLSFLLAGMARGLGMAVGFGQWCCWLY